MPVNTLMLALTAVELLLWAALGFLFWSKKLQGTYPWMHRYVLLNVISTPLQFAVLQWQSHAHGAGISFIAYFAVYWSNYIVGAILLLFVCLEMFRSALSGFSGLMRFGVVVFRWAVLLCLISCLATVHLKQGILVIPAAAYSLMRAVSIVELGLLAFLCLSVNALQLSFRNLCFGVPAGFVLLSVNDFVTSSFASTWTNFNEPIQILHEVVILMVLGVWAGYVARPEPVRKPVVLSANSTIYRWNEIASALGHKGTNVITVPQPSASSFFLTDVEKVVDKVLAKNMKESEGA